MNVLVTDTSSQALTVALRTGTFFESRTLEGRSIQHSERLVPTIMELCKDAGITTKDIELFACTRGPGSFTGLRIGMAALKGMAWASGKPLVSVSTMEACAQCVPYFDGAVVTAQDAKKQRWYLAAFERTSQDPKEAPKRLMDDTDGNVEDLRTALEPYSRILVAGPDSTAFAPVLRQAFPDKTVFTDPFSGLGISKALMECALRQYEAKGADDIGQGPVYIRKSDAEAELEKRLNAEASAQA